MDDIVSLYSEKKKRNSSKTFKDDIRLKQLRTNI